MPSKRNANTGRGGALTQWAREVEAMGPPWTPWRSRAEQDGSTIPASGGHAGAVKWVASCPCWGSEIFVCIDPGGSGIGVSGQRAAGPPEPRPERSSEVNIEGLYRE